MDQAQLDELLNLAADGRLDLSQEAALEAALEPAALAARLEGLDELRRELAAARPELSAEQSRRLWQGIGDRVAAAPVGSPGFAWSSFFARRWAPAWGLGLAGAAALALLAPRVWTPQSSAPASLSVQLPPAAPTSAASAAAPAPKPSLPPAASALRPEPARADARLSSPAAQPRPSLPLASARPAGGTAVERALAGRPVDLWIDRALKERRLASLGSPRRRTSGGTEDVGYAAAAKAETPISTGGRARAGRDAAGFWDWRPVALALNGSDWPQVRAEMESAVQGARGPSERAFASSSLGLLAGPGGPLEGTQPALPETGALRVLAAGGWQLRVDEREAIYGKGATVRLPGLRAEGPGLRLQLGLDRAVFAPGTRFVRLTDETPVKVFGAAGQKVAENVFDAPAGADYNLEDRELRLR